MVFWGDEVEKVITIHPDDNAHLGTHDSFNIFPANLFVTSPQRQAAAIAQIQLDLGRQIEHFSKEARLLEAQRIEERVNYDVEMIKNSDTAPASRTTRAISTAAARATVLSACSTTSRRTSSR